MKMQITTKYKDNLGADEIWQVLVFSFFFFFGAFKKDTLRSLYFPVYLLYNNQINI